MWKTQLYESVCPPVGPSVLLRVREIQLKQTFSAKGAEILNDDFRSGTVLTETCYSFIMLAIANHAVLDHSPMEVIIAEKVDCGFPVSMDI